MLRIAWNQRVILLKLCAAACVLFLVYNRLNGPDNVCLMLFFLYCIVYIGSKMQKDNLSGQSPVSWISSFAMSLLTKGV